MVEITKTEAASRLAYKVDTMQSNVVFTEEGDQGIMLKVILANGDKVEGFLSAEFAEELVEGLQAQITYIERCRREDGE